MEPERGGPGREPDAPPLFAGAAAPGGARPAPGFAPRERSARRFCRTAPGGNRPAARDGRPAAAFPPRFGAGGGPGREGRGKPEGQEGQEGTIAMLGTIVNAAAILVGGGVGLLLKKGLPARISDVIMGGVGLVVLYIGVSGSLSGENVLIAVLSIVAGGALGAWIDLDHALNRLGARAQAAFAGRGGAQGGGSAFAQGFVSASLLFCVGAMAVVGSLQSGLTGDHATLFAKALIDGVSAMVFASAMGAGVLLSAVAVFAYQGAITLLASLLAPVLSDVAVAEMTCVGSLLIVGIGLNLLGVTKLKLANYLPAVFLPLLLVHVL